MVTTETQTQETSRSEREPSERYSIGTGVKLKDTLKPEAAGLITGLFNAASDGPPFSLIEIDENGEMVGAQGGTPVTNVKENLGQLKTTEEVRAILKDLLDELYTSLSTEEKQGIIDRQLGQDQT
jgi:hypothetical protein